MTLVAGGWIDRVDILDPRVRAVGRWNLPETLELFDSHFPRFPVVPGTLILQALVELAMCVVDDADQPEWVLESVEEIRFRRYVRPGDELVLSVDRIDGAQGTVAFRGQAAVDGAAVMTVRRLQLVATAHGARERGT